MWENFLIALVAPDGMHFFRGTDAIVIEHSKATRKLPFRKVLEGNLIGTVYFNTVC